ncbi:hypothetical protein [Streptomyces sp. NPDC048644]|uniref:hypothetical protein n=1 Tax=Streptomyces sp. NPDC048644 TaxID=3365582 RepID=UPI00371E9DD9
MTPLQIDQALMGVNMHWDLGVSCTTTCDKSVVRWESPYAGGIDDGHWDSGEYGPNAAQTANSTVKWTGTGKERIDLSWKVRAEVGVSDIGPVSADFGTSGTADSGELAPRCDDIVGGSVPGCVLPYFNPQYTVDTNLYPAAGTYYWWMQQAMVHHNGSGDELLHYLGPDTKVVSPKTGKPWTSNDSRDKVCGKWTKPPLDASVGAVDCDEFAMASTHESGGFPGGVNEVASGNECAQLFTGKASSGTAAFGLLADMWVDVKGPSAQPKCGRAAVPSKQNQEAFKSFPAPAWRLLDGDGFFLSNPGFDHCSGTEATCAWKKV